MSPSHGTQLLADDLHVHQNSGFVEQTQVQVGLEDLWHALEHDEEFFINYFLGEEVVHKVPEFHKDILKDMYSTSAEQSAWAVPRDHAKTTLAKLAALKYFIFSPFRFTLYLAHTHALAVPCVNDIVRFVDSDNFIAAFGPAEWHTRRDGEGVYVFTINLPYNRGTKRCILRAHGAGQRVRGINIEHTRPQFVVADDLEDKDNIGTEDLFRSLKKWWYGPFKKCLSRIHRKIVYIGNFTQAISLLAHFIKSKFWNSVVYGAILKTGKSLWEDRWPISALKQDFAEYEEAGETDVWFAEMMNIPMPPSGGLIRADEINYAPPVIPGEPAFGFLTVDLAISKREWAHRTVVAVHGYIQERAQWQIVEYQSWHGIDPIVLFEEIVQRMLKWRFYICGIESIAYQASLQYVYEHLARLRNLQHFEWVPIFTGSQRKVTKLAPWAGLLKKTQGQYALTEGDFLMTQQLLLFNPLSENNDDDAIDAGAMGIPMINQYLHQIMSTRGLLETPKTSNLIDMATT